MATDADADEALIRRIEDRSDRIGLEILKEKSKNEMLNNNFKNTMLNNNFKSTMLNNNFKSIRSKSFSKTISYIIVYFV